MTDWNKIATGEGVVGDVEQKMIRVLHASVLYATRDAFDVNKVPPNVVEALEIARSALVAADQSIRALGAIVCATYDAQGLTPTGAPKPPPPTEQQRAEAAAAEDLARRSSHRPER